MRTKKAREKLVALKVASLLYLFILFFYYFNLNSIIS